MKKFSLSGTFRYCVISLIIVLTTLIFVQLNTANAQTVSVTFDVDMTYQYQLGLFDPTVDSIDVIGSMNNWTGSAAMARVGFSFIYRITFPAMESKSLVEFKFRSRGESTRIESPNCGPNRIYRIPETADTTGYVFSDFKPGTVPATFKCNMSFLAKTGRFNLETDYLDIASSINNYGNYDLLYNRGTDSIYEICINVDTSLVTSQTPILYKYRINGNPATEELQGQDYRMARVQDTTAGFQNLFLSWFNNESPDIPTPPVAYNLNLQGELRVGQTLTGTYMFADINGEPEGASTYRWFRADVPTQEVPDTIPGETSVNYLISTADSGKYLAFEVTPVAESDEYNVGQPVKVWSSGKITHDVGIHDLNTKQIRLFPNPASDFLNITGMKGITKIEMFSIAGSKVLMVENEFSSDITLNVKQLEPGFYYIKFQTTGKGYLTSKFIKN